MAKMMNWTAEERLPSFKKAGMSRCIEAAKIIRDKAKENLRSKLTGMTTITRKRGGEISQKREAWKEHGIYQKGQYAGKYWTERHYKAMINTICVYPESPNTDYRTVRIYAGNSKTWWAKQLEFGRGDWHGGAKPFLRPAMQSSLMQIKAVIESGNAETQKGKVSDLSDKVNLNTFGGAESVYQKYTNW